MNQQDVEQLRLLSIFHYVVAGIVAFVSLFPLLHLAMGIAILSGAFESPDGQSPPAFFGWMFVIIPLFVIAAGMSLAVCIAIAGQRLASYRSYMYCLVIAGIECMFMPFGTILGVLTILVLQRPTVRELFGVHTGGQGPAAE